MGDRSEIQWTDATWNPVTGCSKVSPGCAHCYAETLTMRYAKGWKVPGLPWTPENAEQNVILKPERLDQPLRWTKPRMIFVNSMSDLFHELVPDEYIGRVFGTMATARRHVFQVLTKRPERMLDLLDWGKKNEDFDRGLIEGYDPKNAEAKPTWPLPNVWLGTSIENRSWVGRADALRATPAAVRFISAEPLLGPLIPDAIWKGRSVGPSTAPAKRCWSDGHGGPGLDLADIDWLIVGGESGPKHRPVHESWALALREACLAENLRRDPDGCANAGPHFFFKQWGGRTPKAGGRLLEGREWNEMPAALPRAEEVSPA